MKEVILAGGRGTHICEESQLCPKPMTEIGGKPVLWHVMKTYLHSGINDFKVSSWARGCILKHCFSNYFLYIPNISIDMRNNQIEVHLRAAKPWRATLVEPRKEAMAGGRRIGRWSSQIGLV